LRKNSLFILIFFLLLLSCGSIPDMTRDDIGNKENLILNSSFEFGQYDPGLIPFGWFTVVNETRNIFWVGNEAQSGSKSIKVKTSAESIEIISESFPINPSNIYYLQCFLKSLKSKHAAVNLAFMAFDKKGKKVNYYYDTIYPEDIWTKLSFRTGFLDDKARYARVIVILPQSAGTDFWIDSVECFVAHKFTK